jgi:hypothetical protein
MKALDFATKALGVLAAVLGTTGYVLVLGAAILWVRLQGVDLPPEVPVSLASRGELIALGAQAVAVWLVLLLALGGLAAWIVTGDPGRRRFGYVEASLALAVTVSTLLAQESGQWWTVVPVALAVVYTLYGVWCYWPSLDTVTALLLPLGAGVALAFLLDLFNNRSGFATAAGVAVIFGTLMLLTPRLQESRVRQKANRRALARIEAGTRRGREGKDPLEPLATALRQGPGASRSPVVVWIGRIAIGTAALLILGVISVASQLDQDKNFHKVLVSLSNSDCIEGTYIVRGSDQLVIGDANVIDAEPVNSRIATIPVSQVLDVQVFGKELDGRHLKRDDMCAKHATQRLLHPAEKEDQE